MAVKGDPIQALEKGTPQPVYAIDGDERFLIDEAVHKIKDVVLAAKAADFNYDTFDGRTAHLARIIDAAQTCPVFAERRLVVVTQADKLNLDACDNLLAYLKDPNPTSVVVFVAARFDARTKLYKAFQKAGAAVRFDRPRPREMPDLIRRRAQAMGASIDGPAARALAEAVGTDLSGAIQALEVLVLYVGPNSGRAITVQDVEQATSVTKEESIFALVDAIGSGDHGAALRGLHGILGVSREPPLRTLAMIARHYRNLLRARSGLDAGHDRQEVQAAVGVPPYFMDGLLAQARRVPTRGLAKGLTSVDRADRALKGGGLDPRRAMEQLVLDLVRLSTTSS